VAAVAALYAEPARAKVLLALSDGRSLPASRLATEAGVSPQATSGHLRRLLEAGLVRVEPSGRHRYYRVSGPDVTAVLEALARIAPARPVRSLREGNRASALRTARTCYDHLAGRLGVAVTQALLDHRALVAVDGRPDTARRPGDPLSAQRAEHPYELGPHAQQVLGSLGVDLQSLLDARGTRRPLLRTCIDWTEQRHHLAGRLGAAVATAMVDRGWLVRRPRDRAVRLTDSGVQGLRTHLGLTLP
jgi:DNA-binding transcriptional ArsR family regulator